MNSPDSVLPTPPQTVAMLRSAIGQMEFARRYTQELLDATPEELWRKPAAGLPTTIGWQVGHLAVSQYGLLMFRVRGRRPDDLKLIPGRFRKAFGRGSTPKLDDPDPLTPAELRQRMDEVDRQARGELEALLESESATEILLEPVELPYAAYPVKLGAILFCPLHEQIHAGQIGLLRRAHGLDPIR